MPYDAVSAAILSGCLFAAVYTDWKCRRIPDGMIAAGGAVLAAAHLVFHPWELWLYALSALGTYLALAVVAVISNGRLGGGDVKLFALLGFGLGWKTTLWIVMVSHAIGGVAALLLLLVRRVRRGESLPFAPWIMAAFWIVVLPGFRPFYLQ